MNGVRLIETHFSYKAATAAMFEHAARLVERGDTQRFGVFVKRVPGDIAWGVYLRDRQYPVAGRPQNGR